MFTQEGAACRRFGFHDKRLTRGNFDETAENQRFAGFLSFTGEFNGLKAPKKTRKKSVKESKMCDSASFTSSLIVASDAEASVNKPDLKNLNWC